jgi:hypothetical protein
MCKLYGFDYPGGLSKLAEDLRVDAQSTASFADIARVLEQFGLQAHGRRLRVDDLDRLEHPTLLALRNHPSHHFILFAGLHGDHVRIIDPPNEQVLSLDNLQKQWDGAALIVLPPMRKSEGNRSKTDLHCDQPTKHLGSIILPQHDPLEAVFHVSNASRKAVELAEPEKSCGCTEVLLSQSILEPGETIKVRCTIGDIPENAIGRREYYVDLTSAEEHSGSPLRLSMVADFVPRLPLAHDRLTFGQVRRSMLPLSVSTRIIASDKVIEASEARSQVPWIQARISDKELFVNLLPGAPLGRFVQQVIISSGNIASKCEITGLVVGKFKVFPNPVVIRPRNKGLARFRVLAKEPKIDFFDSLVLDFDQSRIAIKPLQEEEVETAYRDFRIQVLRHLETPLIVKIRAEGSQEAIPLEIIQFNQ